MGNKDSPAYYVVIKKDKKTEGIFLDGELCEVLFAPTLNGKGPQSEHDSR